MKKNTKVIKGLNESLNNIRKDINSNVGLLYNDKKKKYDIKLTCLVDYDKK